ncbi:MAG: hypothetical protein E3J26_05715 [Candidatus Zixiibacteriota bacterium]|nr:MAG: hypothetical protein E3J26_05715 [candidate division Zixibacteria bacterium]
MPDEENKKSAGNRVSDSNRFKYIGFEVFPGKPKDLFKSDEEKAKLVDAVVAKRSRGEVIREECTLFEERVSVSDRLILAVACLVILATLFIPWYSAYNEIVEEVVVTPISEMPFDGTVTAAAEGDSALMAAGESPDTTALAATDEPTETPTATEEQAETDSALIEVSSPSEEVIHGLKARKKIYREYSRLSGFGAFLALGSVGAYVFSSGFVLVLIAIILMLYTLLCVALPIYTLYGVYGMKGNADERALELKRILRFNWIPVVLFVAAFVFSFVGADYSFDAAAFYSSLGASFGIGAFLNSLSWGIFVSLCAFLLVAAKGIEI